MANIALIRGSRVENIVVLDPESDDGKAYLAAIQPDGIIDAANTPLAIGQCIDADGQPIPLPSLTAIVRLIPADGATVSTVTYSNVEPDAPAEVTFDVNGATATVALANGIAELDITASQPGPVVVQAQGLELTITATEVA